MTDWLDEIERLYECRLKFVPSKEVVLRMARVLRELAEVIKMVPHTHVVSECWKCRMFDDLDWSDDAKGLISET
jgi:hypothetical protein